MQKSGTRVPFQDQMCQGVIVDTLTSPAHVVQTFTKSLLRSVTLAASVRGAARVPALALLALGRAPAVCWPMQEPRSRLDRLHTAAAQLPARARLDPSSAAMDEDGTGRLEFALDIVNTQFGDFCAKQAQSGGRLQLTVLTADPAVTGKLRLWSRAAAADAGGLQRIQVFEVVSPDELGADVDAAEDVDAAGDVDAVPLDVARTCGDAIRFDQHFQSWLQEQSTASEHVRLLLPPLEAPLSLLFDMQAALVSPLSLPFTHRLLLTSEKTGWHAGGRGEVAVHQLEVTGRLPRGSLCQSLLHGEPVLLRPTASWNQSWEQLVSNTQSVRSLCSELTAAGEVLLARLAGGRSHPDVSGRFAVMPASRPSAGGGGDTLLVCALAPAELVLPPGGGAPYCDDGPVPQQVAAEVQARLGSLPRLTEYNPLEYPSGLSEALAALSQKPSTAHQTPGQTGGTESGRSGHSATSAAPAPAPARGRGGARGGRGRGRARGRPLFWKEDWSEMAP